MKIVMVELSRNNKKKITWLPLSKLLTVGQHIKLLSDGTIWKIEHHLSVQELVEDFKRVNRPKK